MRGKKIFVLKIVWRKSIPSLHRLTQAVQRAKLRRTAGDPTWVFGDIHGYKSIKLLQGAFSVLQPWLTNLYIVYFDQKIKFNNNTKFD